MNLKELTEKLGAFDENITVECVLVNAGHNVIVIESISNHVEEMVLKQYESDDGVVYYTPIFNE